MTATPRPARWAERASLALLSAGATLYGVAFTKMRQLEGGASVVGPEAKVLFAGLAAHARYTRWAEVGFAVAALGLATAIGASIWTARAKRLATT